MNDNESDYVYLIKEKDWTGRAGGNSALIAISKDRSRALNYASNTNGTVFKVRNNHPIISCYINAGNNFV